MTEQQLRRKIQKNYQEVNNKWMRFHWHLLALYAVVSAVVEILMYFVIAGSGQLLCTPQIYWIKYIIVPSVVNILIAVAGGIVLNHKKLPVTKKQYIISILFVGFAFVLSMTHSGFVAVMAAAVMPIMLTVMYENQRLTLVIVVMCVGVQFAGGYLVFWDPAKVVDASYLVNLTIIQIITLCIWLTCHMMIDFMKMKRKISATNDMERYRLQQQINMDGLTNVGNKLALDSSLMDVESGANKECYLVMMDIDNFKRINDTRGHLYGDEVLRHMGEILLDIQGNAGAFRYGGDEFCVLFYNETLEIVCKEIVSVQNRLQTSMKSETDNTQIYSSAGISRYSDAGSSQKFLHQADVAMYESKKRTGNQITIYTEMKQERVQEKERLEEEKETK